MCVVNNDYFTLICSNFKLEVVAMVFCFGIAEDGGVIWEFDK